MNKFLFPYPWKWVGAALVLIGLAGLVYYIFFDFQLILPVFAVISSFLETRLFTIVRTNIADELIMVTLLAGFFLLAFSKERKEEERFDQLRFRAWVRSVQVNSLLLFVSILFFYGNGFLGVLLVNLVSTFIWYLVLFRFLRRKA
ncbi:MAG TPA: hypothetical protein VMC08_00650 [Bacteroidales bacterium]|nr:hypothetical protein [Bacteroidales bacterium]